MIVGCLRYLSLLHHLEEDIRLLRTQVQISHLVYHQQVDAREPVRQLATGAVRERGIHLVKQVLSAKKEPPVAVLQRLEWKRQLLSGPKSPGCRGPGPVLIISGGPDLGVLM